MQYSEILGIEPFFDSTFNMTEERENYWKQFITNVGFKNDITKIISNADGFNRATEFLIIWGGIRTYFYGI